MKSLDRAFLKTARLPRSKLAALSSDSASVLWRAMARICLALDYPGQKRDANGQFGTGKKSGGSSSKRVEKSSNSGTMKSSNRKIPKDSSGKPYRKPRARNLSHKEASKVAHEINTLYHAKFEGHPTGIITTYSPDDDRAYDYLFECHGFDEYNIYSKRRNRK